MIHILVVDDDKDLNRLVCSYLNDSGFSAKGCLSVGDAYNEMYANLYDLIISDIMMPKMDGFEFAETIRRLNANIPIIFLSARYDLSAKDKGFRLGIDDYMVKPVELAELDMRVRALLRRANIAEAKKLTVGDLTLDSDAMTGTVNSEEMPLSTREFNILFKLLSYPNKTFSRAQLMDEFWGVDSDASLRSVDVYITRLRDKTAACTGFEIKTIRGIGYKAVLK
ncbi:response regulator transcription factor [Ruminococcus albus]|uniref:Heme response regulator HssR n=1 Tax=Ruminococcus albus (strain ATCC 27210 / DSM 20455 / JCM 14654 / NCDO 2250 / 7) TaxID=697329 RepID=E6UAJ2_RUMA7|nr:response regulator transcription factor [Ruminococcus albus]ADU22414.1 two component transcriptional regulator, winged helix family [Ruminococcus albus 7 = DSM 20455]